MKTVTALEHLRKNKREMSQVAELQISFRLGSVDLWGPTTHVLGTHPARHTVKDKQRSSEVTNADTSVENQTETGTATVTTTVQPPQTSVGNVTNPQESSEQTLSEEEEKVIRMLYGKSLQGNEALDFAPFATQETRLRLALIEANLLKAFEAGALEPDPESGAPRSVLVDKLG